MKPTDDLYFKSEAVKIIYFLVELDGEARQNKLKITARLYRDIREARKWRDDLLKKVHPDNCDHPMASIAASEINTLYARMISHSSRKKTF